MRARRETIGEEPERGGRLTRLRRALSRRLRFRWVLAAILLVVAASLAYLWLTSSMAWRQALRQQGFMDEMSLPRAGERLLIVAPHPDDEALATGGLIQEARARGATVDVALMTNGDASELALIFGERDLVVSPRRLRELGERRQQESLRALASLGVSADHVHFLSYPNNGLTQLWQPTHWLPSDRFTSRYTNAATSPYSQSATPGATYCGQQVLADLVTLLRRVQPDRVFVPHPKDVHPDHWATNCFVRYALETIAENKGDWAHSVEVYGYLVHWPHFPAPSRSGLQLELLPPGDLAGRGTQWLRLPLLPDEARKKLAAIRLYRSQMPGYDRLLLRFARANETFELLSTQQLPLGGTHAWTDRGFRRRGMGGAEIDRVQLALQPKDRLQVLLTNDRRSIGKRTYLAVDARTWDKHGAPVLMEVLFQRGGVVRATAVTGARRTDITRAVTVTQLSDGYSITLPTSTELAAKQAFFFTCWGCVKERTVDCPVVSAVQLDTGY